ncbi:MAG TPA: mechanosensitive ion channel domain-containing protein [Candidatus Angelobacter sp.]|nr:mechanosensitive ion channel domain-containing protein [Candidatus Angelobacter sp.]
MPKHKNIRIVILLFVLLSLLLAGSWAENTANSPTSTGDDIIPFLNQSVLWYRQLTAQQQLVNAPSDVLFLNDNRQVADEVVRMSFDFARVRAQALAQQGSGSANATSSGSSQYQRLSDLTGKADQQVKQSQQELDNLHQQLDAARGKKRATLQATIAETQSELELFEARRDAMHNMLDMVSQTGGGKLAGGSLQSQIEELARTVPAAADKSKNANQPASNTNSSTVVAPEHKEEPTGLLAIISALFTLQHRVKVLDDNLKLTDALSDSAKSLRAPLVAQIRDLAQKGDQIAAQPDSTDPAVLAQQRQNLDALTAQYKQVSGALMPLGRQSILLDIYRRNTANWRASVHSEYQTALKGLLLRLGGLAIILGVVLGVSELWRKATFRYITDPRRRNQFMVLRRIILWSLIAMILAIAFASELGAITTFAGLLTAGIAVALQNVILSIAGYFFLIGKYGVRVGDRVQVSGITGDVVDIGLVRLHLIEVGGGTNPRATGRAVVFSNSVVFQAGAGLFKQIPGTSFLWHEITVTLGPESNYRQVEQRMLEAVNKVCAKYCEPLDRQRRNLERSMHTVSIGSLVPESRLRLTATGIDVVIRYPVDLTHAAEIDDEVTREVLDAINREPKLRLIGAQVNEKSA